ncbi:Tim44 domain-containing protein [Actinokineospora bangkokensis]|uniref:DUF4878 domain-containing protein n=1 Tax=Actinokineospora bangkokensis TaxID=1193682 RepID=A0A1Q9LKD7_9PSEU|nr:hypothetical protein [Actinokineospora bangkokensis]OLR92517.1 hypothetical protein BJP25_20845 [Actinokineospora bangkokensis]
MSHPQQPPHDPGHPQFGQPQLGQPQYGQPQFGQPQYGQPQGQPQPGGFGAPPPVPPKGKTGPIVAVVAVVLLLGGLAFTGFVAPGFFLSDETPTGQPPTSAPTSSSAPADKGAQDAVKAIVAGLDSGDKDALEELVCSNADSNVESAIRSISAVKGAELVKTKEDGDDVVATVKVTTARGDEEDDVTVTESGGRWCWSDIARARGTTTGKPTASAPRTTAPRSSAPAGDDTPTAGGKPIDPQALAFMRGFLDDLNAGRLEGMTSKLCADSTVTPDKLKQFVEDKTSLSIDAAEDGISSGPESFQAYLKGTSKGQDIEGPSGNLWVTSYDGPWCVHNLRVVTT